MHGLPIREQADRVNEDALELIKGVMQKHTAAMLEAVKERVTKQREKARSLTDELNEVRRQLAASQAREEKLREALHMAESALDECRDYPVTYTEVVEALCIPADDTALRDLIQKAGEVMRERCRFSVPFGQIAIREAIRELPGVTLKDLK